MHAKQSPSSLQDLIELESFLKRELERLRHGSPRRAPLAEFLGDLQGILADGLAQLGAAPGQPREAEPPVPQRVSLARARASETRAAAQPPVRRDVPVPKCESRVWDGEFVIHYDLELAALGREGRTPLLSGRSLRLKK